MPDQPLRMRASALLLGIASVAALSACTALPTDGQVHTSSLGAPNQNAVQVTSRPWDPDMSPEEVVKNFQQAVAGDDDDPAFTTAQTYLMGDAASSWLHPKSKYWVGDTHIYDQMRTVLSSGASAPADGSKTVTVLTTGSLLATVDPYGFYHAEDPAEESQTYTLTRQGKDSWKISTAPQFRLVAQADFRRTTPVPLPVYEVPSAADARIAQHVAQVYVLTAAGNPDYTYQKLADAMLDGQNVKAAVQLDPNGAGNVTVTLSGPLPAGWEYPRVADSLAQTFEAASLSQAAPAALPAFSTLVLLCAHAGGTAQVCPSTSQIGASVPKDLPDPTVYYASGDQIYGATGQAAKGDFDFAPQRVATSLGDGRAFGALAVKRVLGARAGGTPSGTGQPPLSQAFVAASVTDGRDKGWVVVTTDGDPKAPVQRWYQASGKVTSLDWDPVDGSLWIVDAGQLHNVRAPAADGAVQDSGAIWVMPKTMADRTLLRFKLSPDGQQAALVTGATQELVTDNPMAQAWMVQINRPQPGGTGQPLPAADGYYPLLADLKAVTDVAWAGRRALVLLGTDKAMTDAKLYQVYADGSQDAALLGATADAQSSATQIAAQGNEAGAPKFRIFTDGVVDPKRTAIYWKGQTFDPVVTLAPNEQPRPQSLPTLATLALK